MTPGAGCRSACPAICPPWCARSTANGSGSNPPCRLRGLVLGLSAHAAIAFGQEVPPPAYQLAAQQAGVPSPVLYAVALQESGARLRGRLIPWPWTLNVAGRAERYATRAEACAGIRRALARTPANRIDAGLGQVNLGYHAHRYAHPCELLDPYRNLAIAAEILQEQHTPGEDWLVAIGRYHRPAGGRPPPATAAASTST
jgi:soluble lytic murein transglycosylase-like protein